MNKVNSGHIIIETISIIPYHIPPQGFLVKFDIGNFPTPHVPESVSLKSKLDVPFLTDDISHSSLRFHSTRVLGILPSLLYIRNSCPFSHHVQIFVHFRIRSLFTLIQSLGCNQIHLCQTENRSRSFSQTP